MEEERVYVIEKKNKKALDELLAAEPYAPLSFGRISPTIKEIDDKLFLYVKSSEEEVLKFVEEKLKTIEGAKRAEKEDEEKVLKVIKEEQDAAAGGFGDIFG